jgi:hypothetical protein
LNIRFGGQQPGLSQVSDIDGTGNSRDGFNLSQITNHKGAFGQSKGSTRNLGQYLTGLVYDQKVDKIVQILTGPFATIAVAAGQLGGQAGKG